MIERPVPHGILAEISKNFDTISFENYGSAYTKNCRSLKIEYRELAEENITVTVMNPKTFEPTVCENVNSYYSFIVRGVFDEIIRSADIYEIHVIGPVVYVS